MKTQLLFAATLLAFASGTAMADGAALYAEKTCIACHGKEGKKALTNLPQTRGAKCCVHGATNA